MAIAYNRCGYYIFLLNFGVLVLSNKIKEIEWTLNVINLVDQLCLDARDIWRADIRKIISAAYHSKDISVLMVALYHHTIDLKWYLEAGVKVISGSWRHNNVPINKSNQYETANDLH